jgi:hypothetical protein
MMTRRAIGQLLLVCGGRSWVEVCSGNGIDSSPFVGATADAGRAIVRGWRMRRHHSIGQKRCWSIVSLAVNCRTRLQNSPTCRQGQMCRLLYSLVLMAWAEEKVGVGKVGS